MKTFRLLAVEVIAAAGVLALAAPIHNNHSAAAALAHPDRFLYTIGDMQDTASQWAQPVGVAASPDGTIFMADPANYRIQRFDADGAFLGAWGSRGRGEGQFGGEYYGPTAIAVATDGSVFVLDAGNHRVQHFDPDGTFLGAWGSSGSGLGQLGGVEFNSGIAVAADGTIFVADTYNRRVQRFSAEGRYLGQFGRHDSVEVLWFQPAGVAVAPDGTIYVADYGSYKVRRYAMDGSLLATWGQ